MIIDLNSDKLKRILKRGEISEGDYLPVVIDIINTVKAGGDKSLINLTKKYDNHDLNIISPMSDHEINLIISQVSSERLKHLEQASCRIRNFHEKQLEKSWYYYDHNIMLGQKITPLDSVGVYVPGGKASYPSSVLMNVIPAVVAGVKRIVMVNPTPGGYKDPTVIAAAKLAGVTEIFNIGGAQAIAALAYGTESIPKVDKIVGPGNIYVALAKKMVFGTVDIDMIAGPSEILIIADESCNPSWVAADMLSQAEHDELASAVSIVTSKKLAESIESELIKQLGNLSRKEIAEKAINNFSAIIVVESLEQACEIANYIAPEHLELCVNSPLELLKNIRHAGAIFLGHYTPEASGDYFAGTNHVLPTGGSAKFFSPLGVYDFFKRSSLIYYTKDDLSLHCGAIADLAQSEGLEAHRKSVEIRFE